MYDYSEKVIGLTVELGVSTKVQVPAVDSIFFKYESQDSLWYKIAKHDISSFATDTFGVFHFYKHEALSNSLTKNISKKFYVYCTKGRVIRRIKDVVFAMDECKSNIVVFRFSTIDSLKYGHPIFCSKEKLNLTYKSNLEFDKKLVLFSAGIQADYSDSMQSVTFAYSDTLFYTYSDNFKWNLTEQNDCLFPSRAIFVKPLHSDTISCQWAQGLDLFGIPCD